MKPRGLQLKTCVGPLFQKETGMPKGFSELCIYGENKQFTETAIVAPCVSKLASNQSLVKIDIGFSKSESSYLAQSIKLISHKIPHADWQTQSKKF